MYQKLSNVIRQKLRMESKDKEIPAKKMAKIFKLVRRARQFLGGAISVSDSSPEKSSGGGSGKTKAGSGKGKAKERADGAIDATAGSLGSHLPSCSKDRLTQILDEIATGECTVCLSAIDGAMVTACGHVFCAPCLQGVVLEAAAGSAGGLGSADLPAANCPRCRSPVRLSECARVNQDSLDDEVLSEMDGESAGKAEMKSSKISRFFRTLEVMPTYNHGKFMQFQIDLLIGLKMRFAGK